MEPARHTRDERMAIAEVAGAAKRLAGAADREAAIAELHSITADAHLLAHGVPGAGDWQREAVVELLLAAGATVGGIARVDAERVQWQIR